MFIDNSINTFKKITGFDVEQLINDYISFIESKRPNIIRFYGGETSTPDSDSFDELNRLLKQVNIALTSVELTANFYNNTSSWDLLEKLEDIKTSLETTENISVYLRSSITKNNFNKSPVFDYTIKQNQTIENVSRDVSNDGDHQNDWVDIAIRNNITEEEYDLLGGKTVELSKEGGESIFINSVVANIQGEEMYGRDLNRVISFEDSDMAQLTPKKTIKQAVEILSGLRKNNNPEFARDGIDPSIAVGTNVSALSYPILARQIYSTFQKDDTIDSITITKLERKEDGLFVEYEIRTKLGESLQQTTRL